LNYILRWLVGFGATTFGAATSLDSQEKFGKVMAVRKLENQLYTNK